MKAAGRLLLVKTSDQFYDAEASGLKPNTLRMLSAAELRALNRAQAQADEWPSPLMIRVTSATNRQEWFEREVTGWWIVGELLGTTLVLICWRHPR